MADGFISSEFTHSCDDLCHSFLRVIDAEVFCLADALPDVSSFLYLLTDS